MVCLRMYVCWWILKLGDYVLGHFTKSFVCYFCEDDRYGLVIAFSSHIILYTIFRFFVGPFFSHLCLFYGKISVMALYYEIERFFNFQIQDGM